jgi:uracil-DNA glycosylase family 4
MTLDDVKRAYATCTLCEKCLNTEKVFGWGNVNAEIAVIGECPGEQEIKQKIPFVGPAGQLLDRILLAVSIKRESVYFTNSVICRTNFKNRTPTKAEYSNCRKRLFDELSVVNPHYVLLVGSIALKSIMGDNYSVMQTHGEWFTNLNAPCFFYYSLLHPAWILHASTDGETKIRKTIMWKDIKQFRDGINVFDTTIDWGKTNNEAQRKCREGISI